MPKGNKDRRDKDYKHKYSLNSDTDRNRDSNIGNNINININININLTQDPPSDQLSNPTTPAGSRAAVKGRVVNSAGRPVSGVLVRVAGTNIQTVTNRNGNFKIDNLPRNTTITLEFFANGTQTPVYTLTVMLSRREVELGKIVLPSAPTLVSINVTPTNPTLTINQSLQFTATGTYSDNSMQDITNQVIWQSTNPSVATISNVVGSKGIATAVGVGTVTISAALGAIKGTSTVVVSGTVLQSIEIIPQNPSIEVGTPVQFTAIGHFSDNSTKELTSLVTWKSSNPSVATISNVEGTKGQVTTLSTGSVSIFAEMGGVEGSTLLTITPVMLVSIDVIPPNAILKINQTSQFLAIGTFSNHTTRDITHEVLWESSDPAIATVSNGLVTALNVGSVTISATDLNTGVTGSASLTVISTNVGEKVLLIQNMADPDPYDYTIERWNETGYTTVLASSAVITANYTTADQLLQDFWCIWIGCKGEVTDSDVRLWMQPGALIDQFVQKGGILVVNGANNMNATIMAPGGFKFVGQMTGLAVAENAPVIVDKDHEYINGTPYGGVILTDNDFYQWWNTAEGIIQLPVSGFSDSLGVNLGTHPLEGKYNVIMVSPANGNEPEMVEYCYGLGYCLIDMMNFDMWDFGIGDYDDQQDALRQMVNYIVYIRGNFNQ